MKIGRFKMVDKTRNGGQWTESRYRSFIISALRMASMKWGPKNECKKQARVKRGHYRCAECGEVVPASIKEGRKKHNNVFVDHIVPVIDPEIGFTTWDDYINRMFCEVENLQVICKACHDVKTTEERGIAAKRRRKEKGGNNED